MVQPTLISNRLANSSYLQIIKLRITPTSRALTYVLCITTILEMDTLIVNILDISA